MKLVTIQDIKVFKKLIDNKIYKSNFYYIFSELDDKESATAESYQILMNKYKYQSVPVFCCVLDKLADFHGTKLHKNSILLELNVPDEFINIIWFGKWLDILYFTYYKNKYSEEEYQKLIKSALYYENTDDYEDTVQAIIPYIKPEWLVGAYKVDSNFMDLYSGHEYIRESSFNTLYCIYKRP